MKYNKVELIENFSFDKTINIAKTFISKVEKNQMNKIKMLVTATTK